MSDVPADDFPELFAPPPEFDRAPAWARELYRQQRQDRHNTRNEIQKVHAVVAGLQRGQKATNDKLGAEPDSDGKNGKGLIGDVRKLARDVASLMELKAKGLGFIAAIGVTSTLLILGAAHWVQSVVHPTPK